MTLPGYLAGRSPHNKNMRYPADPPRVEEIIAVMRQAGEARHGLQVRGLIVVLWRAGLRISEALALMESDVDPGRGSVLVRQAGSTQEVGLDDWAFEHLNVWAEQRVQLPVGPLFCILDGPTRGRACRSTSSNVSSGIPTSAPPRPISKIDPSEIINALHSRRAPMMPGSAALRR